MIVTIAEQFTSDPSDRERSPTIIWKPGFMQTRILDLPHFTTSCLDKRMVGMCTIKIFRGGSRGGGWGGANSEVCLKWGGGGEGSLRNLN